MALRLLFALLLAALPRLAAGQAAPPLPAAAAPEYEILGISVEGVGDDATRAFVQQRSGLAIGQRVTVPGDPALAEAIRLIYQQGSFSDVKVAVERTVEDGVYLAIQVQEEPKLAEYDFEGVKKRRKDDLEDKITLLRGAPVRPSDLERARQSIVDFYREKGYLLADVEAVEEVDAARNTVDLTFRVEKGPRVEVGDIVIEGNEEVSDRSLRRKLKETKENRWWRFWKKETFDEDTFDEDLDNLVAFYNRKGYFDAQVLRDTVYVENEDGDPELTVRVEVREGPQYHVRSVDWEGNTVYTDEQLTAALGFEPGDVFNRSQLEENLYANKASTDVASLYMNRGYMRFNAEPMISLVEGDSLDITFDVTEGDVYTFGDIEIAGNTKTKEHVIRRELYTVPGQTFSRTNIQESIRRLSQLSYFAPEAMQAGPTVNIDESSKTVDLQYNLEEVGSDQLELSGTWGRFGLIMQLRFGFNNFSAQRLFDKDAWRPLPSGDGQKLSLSLQTNGTYYQQYALSFTEPWFRGRPTPVGFSLSHSRIGQNPYYQSSGGFVTSSARVFYDRRLKWPDDYFNSSSSIGYQYFANNGYSTFLPSGVSQEVTFRQSISRNSLDNPTFPMSGSSAELSLQVAAPLPGFIQYHKWRFKNSWNVPLLPKVSLGLGTDYGYIGSLTGEEVAFERFDVGGSPFESQGFYNYGTDLVYMRGYPRSAIGPRRDGDAVGGTILNRYTSELRWLAIQSPQLQAAPYLFLDAANTWSDFASYNPAELYRAGGLGVRLFLPIVGMLELTYGYNFDAFEPIAGQRSSHTGENRWYFQFSLGQGFGL